MKPQRTGEWIIESLNDMLENKIVHSRHRSVSNFIMNLISALGAYCLFDNKPKALQRSLGDFLTRYSGHVKEFAIFQHEQIQRYQYCRLILRIQYL